MATAVTKQKSAVYLLDRSVLITQRLIEQFLNALKERGRQTQTIQIYRRYLQELYDFLPQEKELTRKTLEDWRESLKKSGYLGNTVNARLAAINSMLRYCGAKDLCIPYERVQREDDLPELTRPEYLEFLSAASRMGKEREYFLIKVFGSIGLNIGDLDYLTVKSIREGVIKLPDGKEKPVPDSLKNEFLSYADHTGIKEGSLFVTSSGKPLNRSNITKAILLLAKEAGLEPERCNPRALNRMYQTTQNELMDNLKSFYLQSYDNLLNAEQTTVRQ